MMRDPSQERLMSLHSLDSPYYNKSRGTIWRRIAVMALFSVLLFFSITILFDNLLFITAATAVIPSHHDTPHSSSEKLEDELINPTSTVPQYFQTSPQLWAGPTATGRAPFLAQTNPVSFEPTVSFVPNTPLETAIPVVGGGVQNDSIFHLMGQLSPYFPNPNGFGVAEYPLPEGASIVQVQVSIS